MKGHALPGNSDDRLTSVEARKYFVFRQPVIRGACILAVIGTHISPLGKDFLNFCVPVFVLLSGFYLSLSKRNEKVPGFYRRTLHYLLIPYVAYSALFAMPWILKGTSWRQLAELFLSSNLEAHLWFMPMIIGLYILHPWLRRVFRRQPLLTFLGAMVLQVWVWPLMRRSGLPPGAATTTLSFLAMIGYFVAGYFLLEQVRPAVRLCRSPWGKVAVTALWLHWPVITTFFDRSPFAGLGGKVLLTVSSLAAFFVLAFLSRPAFAAGKRIVGWVSPFGLYSFGVYLLHPLLISVFSKALGLTLGWEQEGLPGYPIIFLLTAPAALFMVKWVARLPYGRYLT